MNPLSKIAFFLEPNPLSRAPGSNRLAYAFSRYFRYRRSRFGFSALLKWFWKATQYEYQLNEDPQLNILTRVADFGDQLAVEESFLTKIYDLEKAPGDIDLVVDLGAHIGCFTLLSNRRFAGVQKVCVEPDRQNYQLLIQNLDRNQVKAQTHNVAVSDFEGQADMVGDVGIGKRLEVDDAGSSTEVRCLSQLVDFSGTKSLLLKCDTEGSEFKILDEVMDHLPQKVFMYIEVHEGESSVYRLRHILGPHGFEVEETHGKGLARDCIAFRG